MQDRENQENEEYDGEDSVNVEPDYSILKQIVLLHTRVAWKHFTVIATVTLHFQLILYDISFRARTAFPQPSDDFLDGKMVMDAIYAFDVVSAIIYKRWTSLSSTYGQPTRPLTSLVVDVISLLPFDWAYRLVSSVDDTRVFCLLGMNHLLQIHRLFSFFNATRNSVGQRRVSIRILEFLILIFVTTGVAVAVMIYAVDMVNLELNWLKIIEERSSYPTNEFEWFVISYYIMMTQVSGHGLPEVYPGTSSFAFIVIVLVTLWILQAFEIAYLTDIIVQRDYSLSLFHRKMHLVVNYLEDINATKGTKETVKKYYKYFWKTQGNSEFKIMEFHMFPSVFLKECALELTWDAYRHSHLFRDHPIPFLRNLAIYFEREYYSPGDVIIRKYDKKSKLIYVVTGVIQFLSEEDDQSPILNFSGGTIICESTLVLGHRSLCNVVACTEVELHVLHRENFARLMVYRYQDIYRIIQSKVRFRYWQALRMVTVGTALQKNKSHIVSVPACTDVAWLKQTLTVLQNRQNRTVSKKEKKDVQYEAIFSHSDIRYTFANLDMLVISEDMAIMTEQVCLNKGQIPWIFYPQSSILNYWNGFVLICCFFLSTIIPTYASQPKFQDIELTFLVNILCPVYLIDLIIASSTAIYENDMVRINIIDIISKRMHNVTYWADVVAAVPVDWILMMFGIYDKQTLAYCRINRLVKIYKFEVFFSSLENRMIQSSYKIRIMKYTFYMTILTYFASACILLTACPNGDCESSGWLQTFITSSNKDMQAKFAFPAVLYASQILVGIGTDVVFPKLVLEYSISIPLLVVGAAVFNYVISSVAASQILGGFTKSWLRFNTMNIALLLDLNNVAKSIQQRVFHYLEMEWVENNAYVLTFKRQIFDTMTPKLRKELNTERLGSLIKRVDLFEEMDAECIEEICSVCNLSLLPPGEVVGYRGNECKMMYIVEKGHCQFWRNIDTEPIDVTNGKALYVLEMLCDLKQFHTVTTVTHVSLVQIAFKDLMLILAQFPMSKTILMNMVNEFKKSDQFAKLLTMQSTIPEQNMTKEIEQKWKQIDKLSRTKKKPKTHSHGVKKTSDIDTEKRSWKQTIMMIFLVKSTIKPDGKFIKIWEGVRCICAYLLIMVYSADAVLSQIISEALMIDFRLPHESTSDSVFQGMTLALNLTMVIDLYIRMHVQFYNRHKILVTHPLSTANNYFRSGFIVDVLALFPLEHFFIARQFQKSYQKIVWLCRLNRLIMAHRLIGALRHYHSWPYMSKYLNCVIFLPVIILTAHVFACALLLEFCEMGSHIEKSEKFVAGIYCSPKNVEFKYDVEDPITPIKMYVYSLLYVFATITKIGAVNLKPLSHAAILCVLVMTLVSFVLLMVHTTHTVSTISRRDATLTAYQEQMMILVSYLKEKKVSMEIREQVVNYFENFWILKRGTSVMKQMQIFPPALREDVLWCVYGPSLMKSPGFSKKNESFFRSLFSHMKVKFYSKGSEIMMINLIHSSVYFIHWGLAEVLGPDGTRISVLGCGSIFGNFTGSSTMRQTCSIVTRTHMEAIVISSADFFDLLMRHQSAKKSFLAAIALNTDYLRVESSTKEVEIANQTTKKPSYFILLPNTTLAEAWEIFSVLFSCYLAFAICLYHVAVTEFSGYWLLILYAVDFGFLVKMISVFFIAFEDGLGDYVRDKRLIAKRFCQSKFGLYFHIFTIIPFEVLCLFIDDLEARSDAFAWLRMNRVPRLILFVNHFRTACNRLNINISGKRICYAAVLLVSLLHSITCLTIISWKATDKDTTILEGLRIYVDNFYTVLQMFTIISARIVPRNTQEALYLVLVSLAFYVAHSVLLGEVCAVIDVNQFIMNEYERKITFFRERVKRMNLTYVLRESTWSYVSKLWNLRRGQQTPGLIREAPLYLQHAVTYEMYGRHLMGSEIFGKLHEDFLKQLASHFKDNLFFPGDKIVNLGDVDETMYFIDKGTVDVSAPDGNVAEETKPLPRTLGPGDSFGVLQGLYKKIPHTATHTAKTTTHVIYLYRLDWMYLLKYFPATTIDLYRLATRIIRANGLQVDT